MIFFIEFIFNLFPACLIGLKIQLQIQRAAETKMSPTDKVSATYVSLTVETHKKW